ncbi:E3 ubiquitin-protein ligase UPL3 [Glycine soja]|uniref:E3 ubiquitin-protein ligase UPL3 n=1 Tax=Glycine soja TaxID=3848 RepID=A0A0B2REQ9_GLYSO|nr:E3 ubiquitin-protein ligase UPL3 [Glycine soja]
MLNHDPGCVFLFCTLSSKTHRFSPKGLVIGSSNILEIAGQGALVPLYQRLQSNVIAKDSESSNSNKIIWVLFVLMALKLLLTPYFKVDINNLEEYISLVIDATIKTGIMRQIEAFRAGFK